MASAARQSPVFFEAAPESTEARDGWDIVLRYQEEGDGPWVVDLSHLPRWDLQDGDLMRFRSAGIDIPEPIGKSAVNINEGVAVSRVNRSQAGIWHLAPGGPEIPRDAAFTDLRESTLCLAVFGKSALGLSEKISRLDLAGPDHEPPCMLQGPIGGVPCQVVLLGGQAGVEGFVFACARGYGRDMARVVMDAGRSSGLHPAGERRFLEWMDALRRHV